MPWSRVKIIKRRWIMHEKLLFYIISLFLFWGFWSWFVFLNSLSVLWFNFVFLFCMCFRFGMFISVLRFMFLFSQVRSVFLFWDLYFCFLVVFFCFGFAVSCFCIDGTLRKEKQFALSFLLLFVASGAINYRARIGIHFYAWCTKNSTRKEIRSFHNTKNSYCTTL